MRVCVLVLRQDDASSSDDIEALIAEALEHKHAPCLEKVTLDDSDGKTTVKGCSDIVKDEWESDRSKKGESNKQKENDLLDKALWKAEAEHVDG